ncbi:MAG: type VI secretion system protein TssA [Pseudomonadota bacterium]
MTDRSDEAPSGENLEYEPEFAALELAAQPGEERQMGDEIVAGEPPDYSTVIEKAFEVLKYSHDLRAALHMARAELELNGYPGFAKVTSYIRGLLEQYWDTCHPQLDDEDDDDPTMRINAIVGLSDDATIVGPLRRAPLTRSQAFGMVSLRDIDISKGETQAGADEDRVLDEASIAAAFKDTKPELLQEIFEGAQQALEDIKGIDAVFNDKIPGQGPDLSNILKMLQRAVSKLAEETGQYADEPEGEAAVEGDAAPMPHGGAPPASAPGVINSPRDVEAALDRIMAYYAMQEPSSPVPTLLARAKRLVGADFMTIMQDMAPDGINNVKLVGGIKDEDDY